MEKLKGNRLSWYKHLMRREENHVTRRVMNINVKNREEEVGQKEMD
jgi:hypothetical protein